MLLASFAFMSIGSIGFSQPAHAESFLLPKVKCLVGTLFRQECTNNPTVPAPPPSNSTSPSNTSSSGQTTPSSGANTTQSEPGSVPVAPIGSQFEPIDPSIHKPIEITYVGNGSDRSLSSGMMPRTQGSLANYALYGAGSAEVQGAATNLVEPSSKGWMVAGIEWYWWLAGISAIIGAASLVKHLILKNRSALSKIG